MMSTQRTKSTTANLTAKESRYRFRMGRDEKSGCPTMLDYLDRAAIVIVDPDKWSNHRYLLTFGAYGWTRLLVWANGLEAALEIAGEWLAKYAPGYVVVPGSDDYNELMRMECADRDLAWPIPQEAFDDDALIERYNAAEQAAMTDFYQTEAGWISEWGGVIEDPDRDTLRDIVEGF